MTADPSERLAMAALGLPADADGTAARAAFLAALPKQQFVPPPRSVASLRLVAVPALPLPEAARESFQEFEQADVDDFKAQFWKLPPEERAERWQWLRECVQSPALLAELNRLLLAVPLQEPACSTESEKILIEFVRTQYLLPPRSQAVRRIECLLKHSNDHGVRVQSRSINDWVLLDPALFDAILNHRTANYEVAGLDEMQIAASDAEAARQRLLQERKLSTRLRRSAERNYEQLKGNELLGLWISFLIAFLVVIAIAKWNQTPQQSPSVPPQAAPSVMTSSELSNSEAHDFVKTLTPEQVRGMEEYNAKSGKPAPPGYTIWRQAGGVPKPAVPLSNREYQQKQFDDFAKALTRETIREFEAFDPKSGKPAPPGYIQWRLAGGKPNPGPQKAAP